MSELATVNNPSQIPEAIYLKDYRVPNFLIDEINLTFDLHDDYTLVTSAMRVRPNRHSSEQSNELFLNGDELELVSINLNKQLLNETQYQLGEQYLKLINVPNKSFQLEIVTKIYPHKNTALSGLYCSGKTYCTQCEAEGFRRITYYLDHPDILARYTTTITADEKHYPILLSNGNLVDSGKLENGRHFAKWEDPFKKPSYLFALVAGDFDVLEDTYTTQSKRDITLKIFVEKGYRDEAQHAMFCLQEAMHWDELTYGREYDLDIYMIVAISDFNMGAMENKGLNIFNTKYILAKPSTATDDDYIHILSVVGHEYFHNWSGNRVTCRDWFQLSLKEGLTIFRDQTFTEDRLSHAVIRIRDVNYLRENQFPEDAGPLAHAVRPESYIEINNFYTTTVYNKGAEVLRMLRTILGKALFRKGMDLYFARHDGQAVTIEDYVKTMEDVSGIDLTQFRLWYSQIGTPIITVSDDYDVTNKTYNLTLNQSYASHLQKPGILPLLIPIRMGLLDAKGQEMSLELANEAKATEKVLLLSKASQTFQFKNVAERPVPSLLRDFSAPIILNYPYSDSDLLFLFKHDQDPFNRWEAGQKYAVRVMLNLIRDYQHEKPLSLPKQFTDVYQYLLEQTDFDKFLLADMLILPSEKYIGEQLEVIDVDAIHHVREFVLLEIARTLQTLLLKIYTQLHKPDAKYIFNLAEVGQRQLKNRCLLYLLLLTQNADLGLQQFKQALGKNMTDTQPALYGLVNLDLPARDKALQQFYAYWEKDTLVLDKWFAIQASSKLPGTLQNIKKLMRHPAFDIKNPNKVFALIGTFGHRNAINFHARNGEGYAFLRDTVQQLDKLNPQMASRMVKPLTTWKRYDKERQELMRKQLELILQNKISNDLYELVTKSLLTT